MNKKHLLSIAGIALLCVAGVILLLDNNSLGNTQNLFKFHSKKQEHNKVVGATEKLQRDRIENASKSVWTNEEIHQMKNNRDRDFKHSCVHDRIIKEQEDSMDHEAYKQAERQHKSAPSEGSWQPIRFHVNYENIESQNIPQADLDFVKEKLIPAAKAYFQTTFYVRQLSDPIVPSSYYQRGRLCGETKIPSSMFSGVDGADMIMLINGQYASSENYLAYASKCDNGENATRSGRPVIGRFMVNAYYLEKSLNANRWFTWVETAIHEMMHAMGFSSSQFPKFQSSNVYKYNGQNFFAGARVVEYGKQYFNCNSGRGVPLENNGGSGSAGSHWERRALGNEGMTASDFGDAVYSEFTLRLFEDSGWYKYNADNAQALVWEKGSGCATMSGQCDTSNSEHSCNAGQKGCAFDYSGTGYCGNQDPFESGCYSMQPYSNTVCNDNSNYLGQYMSQIGGAIGDNTRCWNIKDTRSYGSQLDSGCFQSFCQDNKPQIKIDGQWLTCNYEGQTLSASGTVVTCPKPEKFCEVESDCPNSCTAQGTCKNGKCHCYNGYSGDDCQNHDGSSSSGNSGYSGSETSVGNGSNDDSKDDSYYCDTNNGISLIDYKGEQYCCDSNYSCCHIFQTPYNGKCYCKTGTSYNSYSNACEPQ